MFDAIGSSWYDPSKITPGADLNSILQSLNGVKLSQAGAATRRQTSGETEGQAAQFQDSWTPDVYTGPNGEKLTNDLGIWNDQLAHGVDDAGATSAEGYKAYQAALAQKAGLDPSQTYLSGWYDNPLTSENGNSARVLYRLDPTTGQAVPINANNYKNQSQWSGFFRPLIENGAATVAAGYGAALGGAALSGASLGADAGAAATAGSGAGLSADSLGYGALENGAAYGSGSGGSLLASSEPGLVEGALGGEALGGGAASDAAGMGLAEGAYPAGIGGAGAVGGGGSGGGLMSQLGGYADDAGSWMKAHPGLTNVGGSIVNGLIGAYTSNKALNAQKDATNQANALLQPYRDTGVSALGRINGLMQNPSSITSDPGYQFGLGQGIQGVDRSAASKGGLYSGATLKALDRYGQDYAGTKLNDAYSRYGSVAQLGATGTQNMANNTTGLGNASAGTAFYQGNTLQNGVNNALGQFNYANGGYYPGQNPLNQSSYDNGRKTIGG